MSVPDGDGPRVPQPGDAAPDFSLPDHTGTQHRLSDRRGGWTVVYFYPKDDTPGCTVEACEFRDAIPVLNGRGAAVWGISPQGARSKAAFSGKFGLDFPLLADEDHAVADAYGSWVEKQQYGRRYMGVARRTFLVDPDGHVARVWEKVTPEGHAGDVLAALDAAQAGRRLDPAPDR
jgi:peroxiredoxin Q/BCP